MRTSSMKMSLPSINLRTRSNTSSLIRSEERRVGKEGRTRWTGDWSADVCSSDLDERTDGHGTAVSGIAAYNDIGQCIGERRFEASAMLFSARVTDNENQFDEDELAEHQLENAVEYFLAN